MSSLNDKDLRKTVNELKEFCSMYVKPSSLQLSVEGGFFFHNMSVIAKRAGLNLDKELIQLQAQNQLKRSINPKMIRPQTTNYTIKTTMISVKHYKEKVYRKRNVLDKETKSFLEQSYVCGNYPNKFEREKIAKKCNISPQQVRVWFGNRRYRDKTQRRQSMKIIHVNSTD